MNAGYQLSIVFRELRNLRIRYCVPATPGTPPEFHTFRALGRCRLAYITRSVLYLRMADALRTHEQSLAALREFRSMQLVANDVLIDEESGLILADLDAAIVALEQLDYLELPRLNEGQGIARLVDRTPRSIVRPKHRMRIALISFEYAGTKASGGIGTYVRITSEMLVLRGHHVHIFTSGEADTRQSVGRCLTVTTLAGSREDFQARAGEAFRLESNAAPFDVLEGPEYGCDAAMAAALVPEIPYVVRLHGPSFTIGRSNAKYVSRRARLRYAAGALRRGRWPTDPWKLDPYVDPERSNAMASDGILANSQATARECSKYWEIPADRFEVVPYAFAPPAALSALSPLPGGSTILFLGRLEVRKGVVELAKAVGKVVAAKPDVRFVFVGRSIPHPDNGKPLVDYLKALTAPWSKNVEFIEGVPYSEVPSLFEKASICVFPSDWEASGFVCMEAMSAARAVVGSSAGGMAEIIENGKSGNLVPPGNPSAIADALIELLSSPDLIKKYATAGRARIQAIHSHDQIYPQQIAAYERAILRATERRLAG